MITVSRSLRCFSSCWAWLCSLKCGFLPASLGQWFPYSRRSSRSKSHPCSGGVLAIACWQVVALIGLRLVALARNQKFEAAAKGWILAIIGCLLTFIVLVMSAYIALIMMGYATPDVMLGLMDGGILALVAATSLAAFLGNRRFQLIGSVRAVAGASA